MVIDCDPFLYHFLFYFLQFLSMKLATVNPRLDFNIEELLAKDVSDLESISVMQISSSILALS